LTPLNNLVWQVVFGRPEKAVEEVWVKGKPVVVGGRVTGMDQAQVIGEAAERGRRLFSQCGAAYEAIRAEAPVIADMVARVMEQPSSAFLAKSIRQ
jgi:hypothetical protein